MSPPGCQKMSAKPCNRNAEESFPVLSLKSWEQKPPNSLLIQDKNVLQPSPDHVHIFCSFPPRYSIAQVVTRFKSLSARAIFREFPRIKRRLWGGELWEDGYFARTVGDKVTAEVIRRYIQQHRLEKSGDAQLSLFE